MESSPRPSAPSARPWIMSACGSFGTALRISPACSRAAAASRSSSRRAWPNATSSVPNSPGADIKLPSACAFAREILEHGVPDLEPVVERLHGHALVEAVRELVLGLHEYGIDAVGRDADRAEHETIGGA